MYLVPDSKNKPDSVVQQVQSMLNAIRTNFHHNWAYLTVDGIYGKDTASAVKSFQQYKGILSQSTANGPILGDTTIEYIRQEYNRIPVIKVAETTAPSTAGRGSGNRNIYSIPPKATLIAYNNYPYIETITDELIKAENIILQQSNNLQRRIKKIPKNARPRHLNKQINKSQEFIKKVQKYGINGAAQITSPSLSKNDVIKYLQDCSNVINSSVVLKFYSKSKNIMVPIRNALKPLYNICKKIPKLQYFGAIDKIVRGTIALIQGEFELTLKLYMDGLREFLEQLIIALLIKLTVTTISSVGWMALVAVIAIIVVSMLIDYFLFSDNPGESIVDKHTKLKTRNWVQDSIAPSTARLMGIKQ